MMYYLIKFLSFILGKMPLSSALFMGRSAGFFCWLLHKRKWIAYANLRAAFLNKYSSKELKNIVRGSYCNLGQTFVELLRFPYITKEYLENNLVISEESKKRIERARKRGKGGIFLTAHLDNWELAGYYSAATGYPLKVLVTEQKISKVNELLNHYRELCGNTVIGKGMPLRDMMNALSHNELMAIVGDQGGARDDMYLRFFNRLAATPQGAFRIAQKYDSAILPCMMVRKDNNYHRVNILDHIEFGKLSDKDADLRRAMEEYFSLLENYIRENPAQWLWGHKRWKYCRTKRVAIISDGKPGHLNQSHAVYQMLEQSVADDRATDGTAFEFELTSIPVHFKSKFRKKLFRCLFPFLFPLMRGRLSMLKYFLEKKSFESILYGYYDITISCGSSVIPLSLLLKRENMAKNILIMKPPFPYNKFNHDLIIKHAHDIYKRRENVIETLVAPTLVSKEFVEEEGKRLIAQSSLDSRQKYISILVGGDTKKYKFDESLFRDNLIAIREIASALGYKILITNSRRTRKDIVQVLKDEFSDQVKTPLFIDVNEYNPKNIVYGMIGVSELVFVTEESVSMISEAVQSYKKVLLVKPSYHSVAPKHTRFHNLLLERKLLRFFRYKESHIEITDYLKDVISEESLKNNYIALQNKLKKLL
ncbi:ELM1/GtrOC1 family putative glycosyltransferase [Candidatus Omnitrophota bacterium]